MIARKFNYTLRIVTKEGESLTPGGSISGGAYRNVSNLLGRRREIEGLEARIKKLQKQAKDLNEDKEKEDKRADLLINLEEAKQFFRKISLAKHSKDNRNKQKLKA